MQIQFILEGLQGLLGAPTGYRGEQMSFTLPYHVYDPRDRLSAGEIREAYSAAQREAEKRGVDFSVIADVWATVDTTGLKELRTSEYFGALVEIVRGMAADSGATGGYKKRLLRAKLTTLAELLERANAINPSDFGAIAEVGPVTVSGPLGTLEGLAPDFTGIRDQAVQAIKAAQERAIAAFKAVFEPARTKIEQDARNEVLALIGPAARQLAVQHGWNIEERDGSLVFTRKVNGKIHKIELPLPAPATPHVETVAGCAPRTATTECELSGTPS